MSAISEAVRWNLVRYSLIVLMRYGMGMHSKSASRNGEKLDVGDGVCDGVDVVDARRSGEGLCEGITSKGWRSM